METRNDFSIRTGTVTRGHKSAISVLLRILFRYWFRRMGERLEARWNNITAENICSVRNTKFSTNGGHARQLLTKIRNIFRLVLHEAVPILE